MGKQNYGDSVTLIDGTYTASATGNWITSASVGALRRAAEIVFVLDVTAAATAAGDTLDVKVQEGLPGKSGLIANDRVHFTQVLGNGGAKQYVAKIRTGVNVSATSAPSTALAASTVVDGPLPDAIRFVVTIASASAPSFTVSLKAYIKG